MDGLLNGGKFESKFLATLRNFCTCRIIRVRFSGKKIISKSHLRKKIGKYFHNKISTDNKNFDEVGKFWNFGKFLKREGKLM